MCVFCDDCAVLWNSSWDAMFIATALYGQLIMWDEREAYFYLAAADDWFGLGGSVAMFLQRHHRGHYCGADVGAVWICEGAFSIYSNASKNNTNNAIFMQAFCRPSNSIVSDAAIRYSNSCIECICWLENGSTKEAAMCVVRCIFMARILYPFCLCLHFFAAQLMLLFLILVIREPENSRNASR